MLQVLVDDLRVRDEPGLRGTAITALSAGQRARVLGGPEGSDGYQWYQISLMPSGMSGWVAAGDGSMAWIGRVLNGKITLASGRDIWAVDEDGNRGLVAQLVEGWNADWPSWGQDGTVLVISENRQGTQDTDLGCVLEGRVAVYDDAGRRIAQSSPPLGSWDSDPAWSPDGSDIAFIRRPLPCGNQPGTADLYVMDANGGDEHLVRSDVTVAVWSPTGDAFAFLRFAPEPTGFGDLRGFEIWTVRADGSGERVLGGRADDGSRERLGDWIGWSADGSVLAYTRAIGPDPGTTEIDLIDMAGQMTALGSVPGHADSVTWLPDGSGVVYVENQSGVVDVVVLSTSGTEIARFEQLDGVPGYPVIVSPDGSSLAWAIQGTAKLRIQPTAGGIARTYETVSGGYLAWQSLLIR
jgi:Tol biopolymer transport system component